MCKKCIAQAGDYDMNVLQVKNTIRAFVKCLLPQSPLPSTYPSVSNRMRSKQERKKEIKSKRSVQMS